MTREEAYKLLKYGMCLNREGYMVIRPGCQKEYFEAVDMGIIALRGPTREMVEKMFPGCPGCDSVTSKWEIKFCPFCGKPRTDEAVEMVMERLEALNEA